MLKISNTSIYLTRGDSGYITLNIMTDDGTPYELNEGDVVHCQVRDKANDGKLYIEGHIEIIRDEIVWYIRPEDTMKLKIGSYVWDAQLTTANGDVFTFIPKSTFKVTDEVTMEE